MRVLLQNAESGLFFGRNNAWAAKADDAFDFLELQIAGRFVQEKKLSNVNVILRYDQPVCELSLNPIYCV